jgi:hypothetical protein
MIHLIGAMALSVALAQAVPHPAPPPPPPAARTVQPPRPAPPPPPPTQRYEFDPDTVEGELARSGDSLVQGSRRIRHSSLIEIRGSMVPELVKTFENL